MQPPMLPPPMNSRIDVLESENERLKRRMEEVETEYEVELKETKDSDTNV